MLRLKIDAFAEVPYVLRVERGKRTGQTGDAVLDAADSMPSAQASIWRPFAAAASALPQHLRKGRQPMRLATQMRLCGGADSFLSVGLRGGQITEPP